MTFVSASSDMLVSTDGGRGHVWVVHSIPNRGRIIQNSYGVTTGGILFPLFQRPRAPTKCSKRSSRVDLNRRHDRGDKLEEHHQIKVDT